MTKKADSSCESTLGDDLIWGVDGIARELKIAPRAAAHLVVEGFIPSGKIGGKVVASRRRLRTFFENAIAAEAG